jgi:hypothetical protein
MKRVALLIIFLLSAAAFLQAQRQFSFRGTVTKMRMTSCVMQRGLMAAMSGTPGQTAGNCPEYTVVSNKVVYVVVGRRAEDFIPLAENIEFLIRKNELIVFPDDHTAKSRFVIEQMTLRTD